VLISNHVLAGANLGLRASSVTGAFAAGLASHVAMDVTPHYLLRRERMASIAVVDGLSGLSIVGAVLAAAPRATRLRVLAGVAGACVLDLDKPGRMLAGRSPFPAVVDRLHARIQTELPQLVGVEVGAAALLTGLLGRSLSTPPTGRGSGRRSPS
jgi:hypothetical protein